MENISLIKADIDGYYANNSYIGILIGKNSGTIINSHAQGTLSFKLPNSSSNAQLLYAGGLIGNNSGDISNSSASVDITDNSNIPNRIGGLVGNLDAGNIRNSYANGRISTTNSGSIGGLVGYTASSTSIIDSYSQSNIVSEYSQTVGGLIGSSNSEIKNSYASGDINYSGRTTTGGLIGYLFNGNIYNSYAMGSIVGTYNGASAIGGLIGTSAPGTTISSSHATGSITADKTDPTVAITGYSGNFGGLIGYSGSNINNSYATGNVEINGGQTVGGLVAYQGFGSILNSYASGNLTGINTTMVGGLIAFYMGSQASLSNSHASGDIKSTNSTYVGGFVGEMSLGEIKNSYANGNINSEDSQYVGGFIGYGGGTIANSYETGSIYEKTSLSNYPPLNAGGFIGTNTYINISNSYASGNVSEISTSSNSSNLGGFVGTNNDTITDAYALGSVSKTGNGNINDNIGGFSGVNWGIVIDAYSIGAVEEKVSDGKTSKIGGFSGLNGNTITDGYFDTDTSGTIIGIGSEENQIETITVTGLTTAEWIEKGPGSTSSQYAFVNPTLWAKGTPYAYLSTLPYVIITANGTQTYGTTVINGHIDSAINQSGQNIASTLSGDDLTWAGSALANSSVGSSYSMYGTTYALNGYQATYTNPGSNLAVTPASLTVTLDNQSGTYGQTPALNQSGYRVNGLVNGDTFSSISLSTNASVKSNVGQYYIHGTISGDALKNYTVSYKNSVYTIDPAALVITAHNQSGTYGETPKLDLSDYTASGLVNGDKVSSIALSTSASSKSAVGNYALLASGANGQGLGNYTISYTKAAYTIDPAALVITARNQSGTYGETPKLDLSDYTTSGLVNGDKVSSIALSTSANSKSAVGNYTLLASGANGQGLGNYTISYTKAAYTIDPAALVITTRNQSGTYGETPKLDLSDYTASGLVNGDKVSSIALSTNASSKSAVGNYALLASGANGQGLGNYTISYTKAAYTIDPAALVITAHNQSGTYGETPKLDLSDYTASGLVNGDKVSSIALSTSASSKSAVGNYALLASGANGQGLGNYTISYTKAAYTIDPAALVITAHNQSGTYGGAPTLDESAYTVSGLVNGDTVSSVLLSTNAKTLSAIGNYLIFVSSAKGSGLGNYNIKYDSGVYDILSKNNGSNNQIKQDVIFWPLISTFGGSIEPCHNPQTFLVNCLKSRNSNALSPAVSQTSSYRIEYPSLSYSNHLKDTF
nr:MBG domain-containing protein [Acetobacter suratthaniensis]